MQKPVTNSQYPAVLVERHFRPVNLLSLLSGGHEVLAAIFDPLDRPPQLHRGPGNHRLFLIEHHDLGAESPADERSDHPDLVLGQTQIFGHHVPNCNGCLGCIPDGQPPGPLVPVGHDAPVLHSGRRAVVIVKTPFDHQRGFPGDGVKVRAITLDLHHMGINVRPDIRHEFQIVMHARRVRQESALQAGHGIQRLVIDPDPIGRVFGHVPAGGHDHDHRLACKPHFVSGKRHLGALVKDDTCDRRWRDEQRARLP